MWAILIKILWRGDLIKMSKDAYARMMHVGIQKRVYRSSQQWYRGQGAHTEVRTQPHTQAQGGDNSGVGRASHHGVTQQPPASPHTSVNVI